MVPPYQKWSRFENRWMAILARLNISCLLAFKTPPGLPFNSLGESINDADEHYEAHYVSCNLFISG